MIKTLNTSEARDLLICAVSFHPALQLEQMFKWDTLALCGTAVATRLVMPAKHDLDIKMKSVLYEKESGLITEALKNSEVQQQLLQCKVGWSLGMIESRWQRSGGFFRPRE